MAKDKKTLDAKAPEVKHAEVEQVADQKAAKAPSKTAWLDVIGNNIHDTAKENRVMVNVHLKNPETGEKSHGNIFAFKNQLSTPKGAEKFNETAKDPAKRYILPLGKEDQIEVSFKQPDNTYQSKTMTGAELVRQASAYQADVVAARQAARDAKAAEKQEAKPAEKVAEQPAANTKASNRLYLHVTGAQIHGTKDESLVRVHIGLKDPETGEKSVGNMFKSTNSVIEFENDKAHNAEATKDADRRYAISLKKDSMVELSFKQADGSYERKKMLSDDVIKQNDAYRADLNAARHAENEVKTVDATPAKVDRGAQAEARLHVDVPAESPEMQAGN